MVGNAPIFRSVVLVALAASQPAFAACPTAEDAATGIRVDYTDFHSIYTRDATGRVTEIEYADDGPYVYISDNGLIETAYNDPNTTGDTFTYDFDPSTFVPPKPWSGLSGIQTVTEGNGEVSTVPFSVHSRGVRNVQIGGCDYTAIGVQAYYYNDDGRTMVAFDFIQELNLPITVGYGDDFGFDKFQPTGITAVEQ